MGADNKCGVAGGVACGAAAVGAAADFAMDEADRAYALNLKRIEAQTEERLERLTDVLLRFDDVSVAQ